MKEFWKKLLAVFTALIVWSTSSSLLGFPLELSYGGRLADSEGKPVTGPVDLRVQFQGKRIGAPSEVTVDDFMGVKLLDGTFQLSIKLSAKELHRLTRDDKELWVKITDLTHGVTYPAQKFPSVPYAVKIPIDGKRLSFNDQGELKMEDIGALNLQSQDPKGSLKLQASSSQLGNLEWILPSSEGTEGQFLKTTDGKGKLSWGTPSGASDMNQSSYDRNKDGKLDVSENSELLNGKNPDFLLNVENFTPGVTQHIFTKTDKAKIARLAKTEGNPAAIPLKNMVQGKYAKKVGASLSHPTTSPDWGSVNHGDIVKDGDLTWTVDAFTGLDTKASWEENKDYGIGDTININSSGWLARVTDTNSLKCQDTIRTAKSGKTEPYWPAVDNTRVVDGDLVWEVDKTLTPDPDLPDKKKEWTANSTYTVGDIVAGSRQTRTKRM